MNHRPTPAPRNSTEPSSPPSIAERLHNILATKSLTLYAVAAESRRRHPHEPSYHVPHNFYFQLEAGLTPTLHQVSALSELTGYRFADWLRVFGFHLNDVARVQASLPRPRTTLLDARVQEPDVQVSWLRDRYTRDAGSRVTPMSQILGPAGKLPVSLLPFPIEPSRFYYAKIGQQDALAFPDLAPGSIVRANPELTACCARRTQSSNLRNIFLIEHSSGVCCSCLHFGKRDRITLLPRQLPFASVEFELGSQARILGVVDFEFRSFSSEKLQAARRCMVPEVAPNLARQWIPTALAANRSSRPAQMLREARRRAALSLRTASHLSREVAEELGDERYFASQGSLSDYEANDRLPRHIHKLLTLCILYAFSMPELLKAYGLDLTAGADTMPRERISGVDSLPDPHPKAQPARGFLSDVLMRFGELPFFLYGSVAAFSGLPNLSLNDVFWIGGDPKPLHPVLAGALFALIHRRKTTPPAFLRKALWERPLYLVLTRDGSYFLANCTLEGNTIVAHPHADGFVPQERFEQRVDAEVVGQVVAVVRSLLPPA